MKYCAYCGQEIDENIKFCPHCGAAVEKDIFVSSMETPKIHKSTNYQLETILGILAIVFSVLNYIGIIFVHLVGIVLGIIVISLVSKDKKMHIQHSQVGFVLGIIGLILGVVAVIVGIALSM
jgi:uncharacterized membrane protein YvbJ